MAEITLAQVAPVLENRMGMFATDSCTRIGLNKLRPPRQQEYPTPEAREVARGLLDMLTEGHCDSAERIAVEHKRAGNLEMAHGIYSCMLMSEDSYDKSYVWGWIKVLLLNKSFCDAFFLVAYLYSFNACLNRIRLDAGESLDEWKGWGEPPVHENAFSAPAYIRQVSQRGLASRDEVRIAISAYGGSDYWRSNFSLSDSEYREFKKYFG